MMLWNRGYMKAEPGQVKQTVDLQAVNEAMYQETNHTDILHRLVSEVPARQKKW